MKNLFHTLCILITALFFAGWFLLNPQVSDAATIDPSFEFSTIETDNFVIHFHQGLDDIARKAASISEGIHERLTGSLKWSPAEKTQIVLIDSIDFANGMATVLPYNAIYVFAAPPLNDSILGEYEDWLEIVLIHEYTHILTMDTASGYSSVTRKVFGKSIPGYDPLSFLVFLLTAPPNVFMPDWWIEGMATWAETEFTSSGRGRSSFVDMILRMAVLEDSIPRIDQLNGDAPYWPSGNIPYIYGMMLERYIAETYGEEAPGKLNISHSGRLPFFITAPAERLTGLNYSQLYNEMVSEFRAGERKNIERLNSEPLTEFNKIPLKGERLTNPRTSPDGRYIAVNRRDPHFHEDILIVDAKTYEEVSAVRRLPSDHSISWSPDSRKIYFTQADIKNSYNFYQDIYSYGLDDKSIKRITRDMRAKDIDVSPDGRNIVFVKVEAGRQNIAVLALESSDVEIITGMQGYTLSSPKWSPDGRSVVFVKRDISGNTSIELLNLSTKTTEMLTVSDYNNMSPTWSGDGRFIIYSSDRTGVYNLFAFSIAEKKSYQVTHVPGGAFQPDIPAASGKILFSGYSSKGFYIAEMPYDTSGWMSMPGPEIKPLWNDNSRQTAADAGEQREETHSLNIREKKAYCPLETLRPRFWLPTLSFDDDGAVFGAFTAGQDVLGYHSYMVQGGYGTGGRGYLDFNYIYDRWYPTFFLRTYSLPVLYSEFFKNNDNYYERHRGLIAGIKLPLSTSLESSLSLAAGYNYEKVSRLTDIHGRTIDGLEVYEGRRDNVFIGLRYEGTLKYPYSISREEGRNISLTYRRYNTDLGSGLDQDEYAIDYEEYMGFKKNHAAYLNLKGAASDGDLIAQQAYRIGGIPSVQNEYSIRGFSSGFQTGKYVIKSTLEYRFPIKYIFRGWNTKPFFWDRLHLAAFADAGNVWGFNKGFDPDDFSAGIGAEARIDMVLGYKLKITPAFGIAQGITDDGVTQAYITVYTEL